MNIQVRFDVYNCLRVIQILEIKIGRLREKYRYDYLVYQNYENKIIFVVGGVDLSQFFKKVKENIVIYFNK